MKISKGLLVGTLAIITGIAGSVATCGIIDSIKNKNSDSEDTTSDDEELDDEESEEDDDDNTEEVLS